MARPRKAKAEPPEQDEGIREVYGDAQQPLRLTWADPNSLDEHPDNWRVHPEFQSEVVRDLINRHGWVKPLIWNRTTQRLLDGHDRRKIAISEGWPAVPVLVGAWPAEDEAEILATLDPSATLALSDSTKLAQVMSQLQESSDSIGKLVTQLAAQEGLATWLAGHRGQDIPAAVPSGNGEPVEDPDGEWQGMPRFSHEDLSAVQTIYVHFKSREDVEAFGQLMEQTVTERTRAIWYPPQEIRRDGEAR